MKTVDDMIKLVSRRMKLNLLFMIIFSGFGFYGVMVFDYDNHLQMAQVAIVFLFTAINGFFWFRSRQQLFELEKEKDWRKK
jgi:hypothetical protein